MESEDDDATPPPPRPGPLLSGVRRRTTSPSASNAANSPTSSPLFLPPLPPLDYDVPTQILSPRSPGSVSGNFDFDQDSQAQDDMMEIDQPVPQELLPATQVASPYIPRNLAGHSPPGVGDLDTEMFELDCTYLHCKPDF